MAYSFPLERIYLAAEFERDKRLSKRVIGTLLDGAFEGPPRNPEIDRLCAQLDRMATMHSPMADRHGVVVRKPARPWPQRQPPSKASTIA